MNDNFWDFSLNTYAKEGVPSVCLALQDRLGVDVNMLLFCCWFGQSRGCIEENLLDQLLEASELWASRVVRPLRDVRSWMKQEVYNELQIPTETVSSLREKVKSNELAAEKIQQELLTSMVNDIAVEKLNAEEQLSAVFENIQKYFSRTQLQPASGDIVEICHVVTSASDIFEAASVEIASGKYF